MRRGVVAVIGLGLGLGACGGDAPGPAPSPSLEPPKDAITKSTENGPVKATVTVWPAKPTLGDPIHLRLEIDAPTGIGIEAPMQEAGDQRLGRFAVIGFTQGTQPIAGGTRHVQTYTLEAQTSGRHRVPPLRIEMVDARTTDTAHRAPQELLTDEVPLDLAPVPTEAAGKPLAPTLGALDPDVGGAGWLWAIGIAGVVAAAGAGGLFLFRAFKSRRLIAQQRSAYDEAIAQLRTLEARGAPDADAADAWYVELSAIVRRYLEHRYDVRAPELTTEEFLQVATARPELHADHRALLSTFLAGCDRVKFAGYRPEAAESLASLEAARAFIEDTRLQEAA